MCVCVCECITSNIGTAKIYTPLFSAATHLTHGKISAANTNRILASFHKTYIHIHSSYSSSYYICLYNALYGLPLRINHIRDILNF